MIVRTFREAEGRLSVVVECYPPEPKIWIAMHFPTHGKEFKWQATAAQIRGWLDQGSRPLNTLIGTGAAQDFAARFRMVLAEIESALGAQP